MIATTQRYPACSPGLPGGADMHRPADGRDARACHERHRHEPVCPAGAGEYRRTGNPCELSAKSLMSVPPVLFEGALIAVTLLLALLAASPPRRERQWPPALSPAPVKGASAIMRLP